LAELRHTARTLSDAEDKPIPQYNVVSNISVNNLQAGTFCYIVHLRMKINEPGT
jgi:hypothetical protein